MRIQLIITIDYVPPVDLERFPRKNVHFPEPSENRLGAWAWKCEIIDQNSKEDGLLVGKTLAIKDCIAIAGVPFLLGTSMFKDYTPVCYTPVLWILVSFVNL